MGQRLVSECRPCRRLSFHPFFGLSKQFARHFQEEEEKCILRQVHVALERMLPRIDCHDIFDH
eukprot:4155017-Amphidinium_carterae.2